MGYSKKYLLMKVDLSIIKLHDEELIVGLGLFTSFVFHHSSINVNLTLTVLHGSNLDCKVDPRTECVKIFIMAVYP